jgi:glutamyl-tRNA reductase
MQVGVLGLNHKVADVCVREELAKACQKCFYLENPVYPHESFVLLTTCNRIELYFSSHDLPDMHQRILAILRKETSIDFEQRCYTFFGKDCFLHLAKVTAGLDSAIIAETEIQGQVRSSYESAKCIRSLSADLHFLFQKSLKAAKDARYTYLQNIPSSELAQLIFQKAELFFSQEIPPVLFVGLSEINCTVASYLSKKNVQTTFCNRTNAKVFDANISSFIPWEHLELLWPEFSCIITATKSPTFLLRRQDLPLTGNKLLIDLAVPRNIDPALASDSICVVNIDDLAALQREKEERVQHMLLQAEHYLISYAEQHTSSFKQKAVCLTL